MKIVSVVGARPEFVQASRLTRALRRDHEEILVHTGQHYDENMSGEFFASLGLPRPDVNLNVGSGTAAGQVAGVLQGLSPVLLEARPDWVIVRGDTNSTLGAALAAAQNGFRIAHIEAGERIGDLSIIEEVNRLIVDRVSSLHLCASRSAVDALAREGIRSAHWVGDVMLDAMAAYRPVSRERSAVPGSLGLRKGGYSLLTLHRPENVDRPDRLAAILRGINQAAEPVVFPIHPRTRGRLASSPVQPGPHVRVIDPVGYLDMIALEENARLIATDSGGVQREAYFLKVPCLTLRDATEWAETVDAGWNRLVPADSAKIAAEWAAPPAGKEHPALFGDGNASEAIVRILAGNG